MYSLHHFLSYLFYKSYSLHAWPEILLENIECGLKSNMGSFPNNWCYRLIASMKLEIKEKLKKREKLQTSSCFVYTDDDDDDNTYRFLSVKEKPKSKRSWNDHEQNLGSLVSLLSVLPLFSFPSLCLWVWSISSHQLP